MAAGDLTVGDAAEEFAHTAGPDALWNESWYYDWALPDCSLGGFTRVGYVPNERRAWYWLHLFTPGGVVAVRDHDVPLPGDLGTQNLRGDALWCEYVCEEPFAHWRLQAETYGVRVPAGRDLYGGERGERVPVAIDLQFEAGAAPAYWPQMSSVVNGVASGRYEQTGRWTGEIRAGEDAYDLDATGERDHSWGVRDWWSLPWIWTAAQTGDVAVNPARPDVPGLDAAAGVTWHGGGPHTVTAFTTEPRYGERRWPEGITETVTDDSGTTLVLQGETVDAAVLPLAAADGRTSRMIRALMRFEDSLGGTGSGFVEFNQCFDGPFAVPADER